MKTFAEMVIAKLQESQQHFASMALPASCERMVGAFVTDSCTPRKPKEEWFQKWHHWQVLDSYNNVVRARLVTGAPEFVPGCACCSGPTIIFYDVAGIPFTIDITLDRVLPITESGPTIPVGWQVVEG